MNVKVNLENCGLELSELSKYQNMVDAWAQGIGFAS